MWSRPSNTATLQRPHTGQLNRAKVLTERDTTATAGPFASVEPSSNVSFLHSSSLCGGTDDIPLFRFWRVVSDKAFGIKQPKKPSGILASPDSARNCRKRPIHCWRSTECNTTQAIRFAHILSFHKPLWLRLSVLDAWLHVSMPCLRNCRVHLPPMVETQGAVVPWLQEAIRERQMISLGSRKRSDRRALQRTYAQHGVVGHPCGVNPMSSHVLKARTFAVVAIAIHLSAYNSLRTQ